MSDPAEKQSSGEASQNQSFKIKVDGQEIEVSREELINLAQQGKDYTKKTQALSEREKTLNAEAVRVAGMRTIVDEMDADPKLKEALNKVYADIKSGKSYKSPDSSDKNLKKIDKLIAESSDPGTKEQLRDIKEIIFESAQEIAEQAIDAKLSKTQEEIALLRNALSIGQSERVESQLSKLEEKLGTELVSKYKKDIVAMALKYPQQSVQKLLNHFADDSEMELAFLNSAKKKEKEEITRKKINSSPTGGGESFTAKTEIKKDRFGRVTFSSLKDRVLERLGKK